MLTKDAVAYFGSQTALARALNITQASVAGWGEVVPPLRQLQLQQLTIGKLMASPEVFEIPTQKAQAA